MPTPLYVASAEAKKLVASRQRALASDYDTSAISSSGGSSSGSGKGGGSSSSGGSSGKGSSSDDAVVIDLEPSTTSTTTSASTSRGSAEKREVTDFTQVDDGAESGSEGSGVNSGSEDENNDTTGGSNGVLDLTQQEGEGEGEEREEEGENNSGSGSDVESVSGNVVTTDTAATTTTSDNVHTAGTNEAMDVEAWAETVDPADLVAVDASVNVDANAYNEHSTVADLFSNVNHATTSDGADHSGSASSGTSEMVVEGDEEEA